MFLWETFAPNLIFITRPSLQILGKTQTRVFSISEYLVNPLQTKIFIDWTLPISTTLYLEHLSVSNNFPGPLNISTNSNFIFFFLSWTSLSETFLYLKQKFRSRFKYSLPISNFLVACSMIQVNYRISYENTVESP